MGVKKARTLIDEAEKYYRGWRMYFTSSGSNNRMRSIKAKRDDIPALSTLEIVLPDSGLSDAKAKIAMRAEIDREMDRLNGPDRT